MGGYRWPQPSLEVRAGLIGSYRWPQPSLEVRAGLIGSYRRPQPSLEVRAASDQQPAPAAIATRCRVVRAALW